MTMTPQQTAEFVRDGMFTRDLAAQALGIEIGSVAPKRTTAVMTVRRDMLNGFGICHGGLIATLADTAFAYGCNSYNEMTVASGFDVDLLAASQEGDVLTSVAEEVHRAGRTGLYDIVVTNQRGERIAVFRGRSYRLKGRPTVAPQAVG